MLIQNIFIKVLKKIIDYLDGAYLFIQFIFSKSGAQYGVGHLKKLLLARQIIRNNRRIKSLSTWKQHFIMIDELFKIPEEIKGDVIECGCYRGASTANLSIACALTGRKLFVCDSFEGIPEANEEEKYEISNDSLDYYVWGKR